MLGGTFTGPPTRMTPELLMSSGSLALRSAVLGAEADEAPEVAPEDPAVGADDAADDSVGTDDAGPAEDDAAESVDDAAGALVEVWP